MYSCFQAIMKFIIMKIFIMWRFLLTLSWRRPLSYRNQSIDLLCESIDWFLYDMGVRHERVKISIIKFIVKTIFARTMQCL